MSANETVRAARLHEHGAPLRVEPVELPEAGADEVRVDLHFAGVNPIDRYIAAGQMAPDGPLPRTQGGEAAGERDGRPVLVAGGGLGAARDGVWAEAVIAPRGAVIDLPDGVAPQVAAAMGVAGLTAWQTVVDLAAVGDQDRVLVLGASGGVGSIIVSLARSLGATVWGQTGSEHKAEFLRAQGAQEVIVGGPEAVAAACGRLEPTVVLDPLGGEFVRPIVDGLAARGAIVSYGTSAGPEVGFNLQALYRKSARLFGYGGMTLTADERRAGLERALDALADGRLRVPVDTVLPLTEVNEAFGRLERREVTGKLVLDLTAG